MARAYTGSPGPRDSPPGALRIETVDTMSGERLRNDVDRAPVSAQIPAEAELPQSLIAQGVGVTFAVACALDDRGRNDFLDQRRLSAIVQRATRFIVGVAQRAGSHVVERQISKEGNNVGYGSRHRTSPQSFEGRQLIPEPRAPRLKSRRLCRRSDSGTTFKDDRLSNVGPALSHLCVCLPWGARPPGRAPSSSPSFATRPGRSRSVGNSLQRQKVDVH